jgi:tRNA-2-methylthio-N6-dimethylallyladenosine synthase
VRGREKSRASDDIMRELDGLLKDGVREVTLLGQNVNSYGRDLFGEPRFARLLREVAASGVERIRFTTSHPKDLGDETIGAFAELPNVMPALHLPVQSGSDAILARMGRKYDSAHYLGLIEKIRAAAEGSGKGQIAFSTDIIVGFPGETQADFDATMSLVRTVGYSQAFTFIYSKREGTPAARMQDDTPRQVVQERFNALVDLVQEGAWASNQSELNTIVDVLVEGVSKRDAQMLTGRSPRNQTVHAPLPPQSAPEEFMGRTVPVLVTQAKTWYLRGELA